MPVVVALRRMRARIFNASTETPVSFFSRRRLLLHSELQCPNDSRDSTATRCGASATRWFAPCASSPCFSRCSRFSVPRPAMRLVSARRRVVVITTAWARPRCEPSLICWRLIWHTRRAQCARLRSSLRRKARACKPCARWCRLRVLRVTSRLWLWRRR